MAPFGRWCCAAPYALFRSDSVLNIGDTPESMSETTSSRLLALLSLLQARRDWPGNELAARLEVSGRTVRRGIDRQPPRGRTALRRQPGPALVPGRVGPEPRGLADVPDRPARSSRLYGRAVRRARAPREGCCGVRRAEHQLRAEPVRGEGHPARTC